MVSKLMFLQKYLCMFKVWNVLLNKSKSQGTNMWQ